MQDTEHETSVEQAQEAAEAIRRLNHSTLPADDWPGIDDASHIAAVVGELSLLADRLPQTIDQLSGWLTHSQHISRNGDTRGAVEALDETRTLADRLVAPLRRAHQSASTITGPSDTSS